MCFPIKDLELVYMYVCLSDDFQIKEKKLEDVKGTSRVNRRFVV